MSGDNGSATNYLLQLRVARVPQYVANVTDIMTEIKQERLRASVRA